MTFHARYQDPSHHHMQGSSPMTDDHSVHETDEGTTRRNLLTGLAGLSALTSLTHAAPAPAAKNQRSIRKTPLKIDVHHHVVAPVWADAMKSGPGAKNVRPWSPEASIDFMDAHAIQAAILSVTSPGV